MQRSPHPRPAGAAAGFLAEMRPLVRLAGPVVTAELGWMTMAIADTMMVGRVSAEALGAVSIGSHLFFAVAIFGMGMLLGLDFMVAHACGTGRIDEAHRALVHGVYLSVVLAVGLTVFVFTTLPLLPLLGLEDAVLRQAIPYLKATTWSLLPLLVFTSLRRYLQALGIVRPIMVTLVTANVVNALAAWVLIFGHLGMPALGAEGAGWATCLARSYMCLALVAYVWLRDRDLRAHISARTLRPEGPRLRTLVQLGLPAALQTTLEVGVFAAATMLIGRLDFTSLAAHQLALTCAGVSFMVPLGISSAGAVRVGQALGREDVAGAERAGWSALVLGGSFMVCAGLTFVLVPRPILRAFTTDGSVIATGVTLLLVAALFQLFDGLQVVATGVLRGTGETRTPMVANLVGHWAFGLPVGVLLCFYGGLGAVGIWIGLSIGLIAVAAALVWTWTRRIRRLAAVAYRLPSHTL